MRAPGAGPAWAKALRQVGASRFPEGKGGLCNLNEMKSWRCSWSKTVQATKVLGTLSQGQKGEPLKESKQRKQSIFIYNRSCQLPCGRTSSEKPRLCIRPTLSLGDLVIWVWSFQVLLPGPSSQGRGRLLFLPHHPQNMGLLQTHLREQTNR